MGRRLAEHHLRALVDHWRALLGLTGAAPLNISVNDLIRLCGHEPDGLSRAARRPFVAAHRALARARQIELGQGEPTGSSGNAVDAWIRDNLVPAGALVSADRRQTMLTGQRERDRRQRRRQAGRQPMLISISAEARERLKQLTALQRGRGLAMTLEALILSTPLQPIVAKRRPSQKALDAGASGQGNLLDEVQPSSTPTSERRQAKTLGISKGRQSG